MFLFIYFLFNALEKGQAEKRRSFNPGYVFDLLHICLFQSLQVRRVGFDEQFTAVSFHRFFPFDNSFLGFFLKHSKAECWGNNHAQGEAPIGRTSFSGRNKHPPGNTAAPDLHVENRKRDGSRLCHALLSQILSL